MMLQTVLESNGIRSKPRYRTIIMDMIDVNIQFQLWHQLKESSFEVVNSDIYGWLMCQRTLHVQTQLLQIFQEAQSADVGQFTNKIPSLQYTELFQVVGNFVNGVCK